MMTWRPHPSMRGGARYCHLSLKCQAVVVVWEQRRAGKQCAKCGIMMVGAKPIVPFREAAGDGRETGFPARQAMPRAP